MIGAERVRGVIERAKAQIDSGASPVIVDVSQKEMVALLAIADTTYNYLVQQVWGRGVEIGELPMISVRVVEPVTGGE